MNSPDLAQCLQDSATLIEESEGLETGSIIRNLVSQYGEGFLCNPNAQEPIDCLIENGVALHMAEVDHVAECAVRS